MDIKFIDNSMASIAKTYKANTEVTTKKTSVEKEEAAPRGDSLVLSPEAKAMMDLSRAAVAETRKMPATRKELVASFQERIENNRYHPDPQKIAEAMLKEFKEEI